MDATDTTPEADAVQLALYRKMTSGQRTQLGHQMSLEARAIARAAIARRHPEYDDEAVRWASFRMLLGDQLFRRVWPDAPLLAP